MEMQEQTTAWADRHRRKDEFLAMLFNKKPMRLAFIAISAQKSFVNAALAASSFEESVYYNRVLTEVVGERAVSEWPLLSQSL